jgi:preprotein translocase subunit SecG
MILTILQILQVLFSFIIIILVIIHSPKGDGLGGIGGAAQLFSSQRGAEAGLNKLTGWSIGIFFVICAITGLYGEFLTGK